MKIAHIVSTYPPYYGGMGNVVFQTVDKLAERGHTVEVITPIYKTQQGEQSLDEQKTYANQMTPSLEYGNAARLPTIGEMLNDFDVVHLHYPFFGTANLVKKWKEKNPDKPLVVTYHMDTRAPSWKGLIFKWYAKFYMPRILGSADALISASLDYIKTSDASEVFKKNKDRTHELPFGVDIKRFADRGKPIDLLEKYNLDPDTPTLVFVGGMDSAHYFKGVSILLKSIYLLKEKGEYIQAVLIGGGSLIEKYAAEAAALGIEDRVRFTGRVSDEELPYYYNLGDIFILPSIHTGEAFGMVLLEAYASGLPVIASDLPGVRSVASHAGVTVPPKNPIQLANAISIYFSKENDQEGWRMKAREVAEKRFSWDHIIDELETLYTTLLK
jgi:glycosyltransferase involved in cell wall biosynthesis